jgi:uncharacterized membrane protein YgaE (UPF0421/DUF939 family)
MFESHREALRQIFKLPRPTVRETAIFSAIYITQAIICILALKGLYHVTGWLGVLWAMITAVLTLQPGIAQSLATSVVRILANTVGAIIAYLVGRYLGDGLWQLLSALTLVVVTCECARLDPALRTACVATIIVLTTNNGHLGTSSFERFSAVTIGCAMAMVIQIITDVLRQLFFHRSLPEPSQLAAAAIEPGKRGSVPSESSR